MGIPERLMKQIFDLTLKVSRQCYVIAIDPDSIGQLAFNEQGMSWPDRRPENPPMAGPMGHGFTFIQTESQKGILSGYDQFVGIYSHGGHFYLHLLIPILPKNVA
jgi:hypothetical protein